MTGEFLDGNVLGGALREIFAVDLTNAVGRCAGCGRMAEVGTARVYASAGAVARCTGCEAVLVRLVTAPGRAFLDRRGVECLEIALP